MGLNERLLPCPHFGLSDLDLALDCDAEMLWIRLGLDLHDCTQRRVDEKE